MASLKIVKLLAAVPGIAVAELPVGLIAWDDNGGFYEEWVPDDRNEFWQDVIQTCRANDVLTPDAVSRWEAHLINGQTIDMAVDQVEVPADETAADVFAQKAADMLEQWASVSSEVSQAIDDAVREQNRG